ncbi:MAG: hypothetical protein AB8B64_16625 [Granulosicoccus sp.]
MSLIFVIAVLTVGYLLYIKYYKVLMSQGKAGQIKLALIVVGLIFLIMAVTGRAPALFAILGAAMTQVMRFAPLLVRFMPSLKKAYTQSTDPGAANRSQVVTKTLKMTLDHSSGTMDGEVLEGSLAGRQLQTLSLDELKALYQHCAQYDPEAGRLLMSFVTRERADTWDGDTGDGPGSEQSGSSHSGATGSSAMDRAEAISILGLEEPFTRKDVTQAHRSLMGKFHPDKGGNTYLATKLNTARDLLLDSIKQA